MPIPLSYAQTQGSASEKYVKLDFNNVDINLLVKFIAELTGKNFIVDQRVKGKVTIISPAKISVDEAFKVFESVLEVHGFATVPAGEVIKIIAAPEARTKNIETMMDGRIRDPEDKIVTQLIPLKYADANEITRLFKAFISKSGAILAYDSTNTLIVTDAYSNITRLLEMLKVIDVQGIGQEISVITLEHSDATKLVRILTTIFQQKKTKGKAAATDEVKFVADERTNVIVLLASEDDSKKIKSLISLLDKEIPRGTEKIRVYYLEHAIAEDLAKVIQSVTQVKGTPTKGKKEAPVISEDVKITADKATNSLIIMAEKEDYVVLEEIISKLDVPRAMVYLECLIMEVNIDKEFNIGTEWMAMAEGSYENRDIGFGGGFDGGGDTSYSRIGSVMSGSLPAGVSLGIFSELIEIGGVKFPNIGAMVSAFKKDKNVNILSTPQILTLENEEASISVGKNVPYLTKSGSSTVESYNTYEYKDVAITLKITPQISKDRMIRLKIDQETTKLDQLATTAENRPTTLKRTINTTVTVYDQNTIAIGGLIDDSFTITEHKVPCVGDIPGFGWLFKSRAKSREKTNLFVFITPRVVETSEEAQAIYDEKNRYINEIESGNIKMYEQGVSVDEKPAGRLTQPKTIE